ncbi:hypothetical protein V8Z80_03985 [Orrella sp. JC864]|uniref:hypothetical protein n=1 Tax=Orrella sp. JC864 TaxID=3120298 RepID=UPI0012BD4CED
MEDVLILAQSGREARWIAEILGEDGMNTRTCPEPGQLVRNLEQGAGCVVAAQEALIGDTRNALCQWLASQPVWSDMPFVLLPCEDGAERGLTDRLVQELGHACVTPWPLQAAALRRATRSALHARRRQYDVRDQLDRLSAARR